MWEFSTNWYYDFWKKWPSIPKVQKIAKLQCLYNMSKKKLEINLIFLHANKHQSSLKVHLNTLGIKISSKVVLSLLMGMINHSQSTKSSKFIISLQYLKKEVKDGVHFFHANKHQSFHKWASSFLMEVTRHVQSTQNRELVIFFNILRKKGSSCFWYKTFRYFIGVQSCSLLLVYC